MFVIACDRNFFIITDGSKNAIVKVVFELQSLCIFEKCS